MIRPNLWKYKNPLILINTKPKPKSAIYMAKMSRKNVIKFKMRNVGILNEPKTTIFIVFLIFLKIILQNTVWKCSKLYRFLWFSSKPLIELEKTNQSFCP